MERLSERVGAMEEMTREANEVTAHAPHKAKDFKRFRLFMNFWHVECV